MKLYAIAIKGKKLYAVHAKERDIRFGFDSFELVSKAEYQKARADGMPSWGEMQTARKMGKFPA